MNTRLKYQTCSLHQEPLNYICLHTRCIDHRIICAICKQQRHPQSHLTMPVKIYLSQKAQQLKCLTKSKIDSIQETLIAHKETISHLINEIKKETNKKLQILQYNCNNFLNEKIKKIRQCSEMINCPEFDIADMNSVQEVLKIVGNYQDFKQQMEGQLISLKEKIQDVLNSAKIQQNRQIYKWQGHKQLSVTQNIINSNSDGYKVAYIGKPITKNFNKAAFRIISAAKNWVAIGVCQQKIVKRRNFDFRYFTIGHGIYAVSCHGGMWSHDQSQNNNTIGNFKFSERQTIIVTYDFNEHKVIFQNQQGIKFSLKVNKKLSDNLRFCLVLYHSNDQVQFINQLSIH